MNESNSITIFLTAILIIILGFFFMNNVMHTGVHWGHNHDHEEVGIINMMSDHDDDDYVEDYEIYPGKVVEKIQNNEDIILLDVRTLEEYAEIHLENSILLPVDELSVNTLAEVGLGKNAKDKEIIIYCRGGARSKQAYDIMNSLGYTNIKSVAGGMIHWQEDNYPFTEIGEYDESDKKLIEVSDNGAKISFNKMTHDFGKVPQSQGVVKTTFEIKNDGQVALQVGELSTSCGCTSAEISEKNILPNGTAILTVSFDPNFHDEPLDKITRTVFIPTNDPNTPEAEVKITIDILEGE